MRLIGSFCVYRVPGRPLGPALRSFCFSLGSLGLSLGRLGAPLGRLGAHFGAPGTALGCLGDALGPLRDTLGSTLACQGIILGHFGTLVSAGTPSQADGSQVPRLRTKTSLLEFARRSRRSRRTGPQTTVQDLPSTRAGDQDDVSFTNSLK